MAEQYFGRTWKLQVLSQFTGETWTISKNDWAPEALRITFDVMQMALSDYWWGDIDIYNVAPGVQDMIQAGDLVTLSAGYQRPQSEHPLIFQGRVFQPLWERTSAYDYKLTLHCLVGKWEDDHGYLNLTFDREMTDFDWAKKACEQLAMDPEYLDSSLHDHVRSRGGAYSGSARLFFDQIAIDHGLQFWWGWNGVNLRSLSPQGTSPNVVYAPPQSSTAITPSLDGITKYTLIGSPQQTQEGCGFRVLMDSDLQLGQLVKLDFSLLRQLTLMPGKLPPRLDKDGLFVVAGINHHGDSRGNDWYSDVRAVTREWSTVYNSMAR
jgi:hypothetical protein